MLFPDPTLQEREREEFGVTLAVLECKVTLCYAM